MQNFIFVFYYDRKMQSFKALLWPMEDHTGRVPPIIKK